MTVEEGDERKLLSQNVINLILRCVLDMKKEDEAEGELV